eukprot:1430741-Ditylum_brightwellii.AAC.1
MLSKYFDGEALIEHLELQCVIGDITQTVFTKTKDIWQVETTKKQVVEAMHHGGIMHFPLLAY